MEKYRGLIIKPDPLDKILYRGKVWEIRGSNLNIKEKVEIALIKSGTDEIHGTCYLVKSFGPVSKEILEQNAEKHLAEDIECLFCRYNRKPYVWELENPKPIDPPIKYTRKPGRVIWVKLENDENKGAIFSD